MRFGISATSWMRPNIFRKRLRPFEEEVCCMWSSQARSDGSPGSPQFDCGGSGEASLTISGFVPGRNPAFLFGVRPGAFQPTLLQLDGRTCGFELLLDLVCLFLVDAFLDRLRRALDQVLGLLQAEAGDRAHLFDNVDLLGP